MGTVLHLRVNHPKPLPLIPVSVPFSMGTVLHLLALGWLGMASPCFSPLLDGDGVASFVVILAGVLYFPRFSPLLDGDGVASSRSVSILRWRLAVSVPFSMGTVLHRCRDGCRRRRSQPFQSPSRWGRCCIGVG